MLKASEEPSEGPARRAFCEWFELLLEKAMDTAEDAASSIWNTKIMLESFIEEVMLRVEARLGENEGVLRTLERRLKADEDGLKSSKLLGQWRVKMKLKSFAASLTFFSNEMLYSSEIDMEGSLKENAARLKSIEINITENEAWEDRAFHTCLGNAANSGFSYRISMFEQSEISSDADSKACDPEACTEV